MEQEEADRALEWLQTNAIKLQDSEIAIAPVQVTDHAWFNCETGLMSISTEIYPPCLECELPSECVHFPRQNVISCMTGDGDGDYLVWALHSNVPSNNSAYVADGAFIILDSSIHATVKYKYGKLRFDSNPLAPILLGVIEVKEYVSSSGGTGYGFLFIADQQVIAYMGDAQFYPFTPRAVGIYGEYFDDAIRESVQGCDFESASNFSAEIFGTEDGTVMSRMGNDLDYLSEKNSEISYERNALLSDSWGFQRYFAGSERIRKKIEEFSPKQNYSSAQWLVIADGLRIRGQKAESTKLINELLGSDLAFSDDEQRYLLAILRALPGFWPA
jgi:hypothetical protein